MNFETYLCVILTLLTIIWTTKVAGYNTKCSGSYGYATSCSYGQSYCCYSSCCNQWDYSFFYSFSTCESRFHSYQTCRDYRSTRCCHKSGFYSTCCGDATSSNPGGLSDSLIYSIAGFSVFAIITIIICAIVCGNRSAMHGRRRGRILGTVGLFGRSQAPPPVTTTPMYQQTQGPYIPGAQPGSYPPGAAPYPTQPYPAQAGAMALTPTNQYQNPDSPYPRQAIAPPGVMSPAPPPARGTKPGVMPSAPPPYRPSPD